MNNGPCILSAETVLRYGLQYVNVDDRRQERLSADARVGLFKAQYGPDPLTCATIWEDLQTTPIPGAKIKRTYLDLKYFLMSLNWLYRYDVDKELSAKFDICVKTLGNWKWFYVLKIAALKGLKIVWPERWDPEHPNFNENEIIFLSVDGTLCATHEFSMTHPTKTKDPKYFSFKHNRAGFLYEVGLSIHTNECVWINGPYPGGQTNDKGVFNEKLIHKIPPGMRALGDSIYKGNSDKITTKNSFDSPEVREFKRRAAARHEIFNGRLKQFDCLSSVFRHSMEKHKMAFEAVAVICQYMMELETPLFTV